MYESHVMSNVPRITYVQDEIKSVLRENTEIQVCIVWILVIMIIRSCCAEGKIRISLLHSSGSSHYYLRQIANEISFRVVFTLIAR